MRIDNFISLFQKKLGVNFYKKQRLENLSHYFREVENNSDIEFSEPDECLTYIMNYLEANEEISEEVLRDLVRILELSVSNRNPYYVMEFEYDDSIELLCEKLNEIFEGEFRYDNVYFSKNSEINCDDIENIIEVEFDFKELDEDPINEREIRKSIGLLKLRFDLGNSKVTSSLAGNRKIHNCMFNYLIRNTLRIKPFYVLKCASTIKNKNSTEFAPTTLIFMNLLFASFKKLDLEFDLEVLDFINVEAINIQGMTLKGTNLLNAKEILHRIHNGDEIMKFKLNVGKIIDNNGHQTYFSTNFEVHFEGKLCFVFDSEEPDSIVKNNLLSNIYDELKSLIYAPDTIEEGIKIINENLPKPKSLQNIVSEIYVSVMGTITDIDERILIEKYFIEAFPLIRLNN